MSAVTAEIFKKYIRCLGRLCRPVFDPRLIFRAVPSYISFIRDFLRYRKGEDLNPVSFVDIHPMIFDKTSYTPFDAHYFYQGVWAFKKIQSACPTQHVDVGSKADFIGFLTTITRVKFVDIRPLDVQLEGYESVAGSVLNLPFADSSVESLSCLHVAEHIGLGRYGDELNPRGTELACKELERILAVNGDLYFSLPIGKPRVCFNAHRIHSTEQILQYYSGLKLIELSGVTDEGKFFTNIDPSELSSANYGCGLFHFRKSR